MLANGGMDELIQEKKKGRGGQDCAGLAFWQFATETEQDETRVLSGSARGGKCKTSTAKRRTWGEGEVGVMGGGVGG